jgi:hypothetical protein
MEGFLKSMGMFFIVLATMLIATSFFVMVTLSKVRKSRLRIFGKMVVALLWVLAVVVYFSGISMYVQSSHTMVKSKGACTRPPSMMGSGSGRGMMGFEQSPMIGKDMPPIKEEIPDKNAPGKNIQK